MYHNVFNKGDWSNLYRDAKETIPMNAPEPCNKEVKIHMFVDSDYAGDKAFCISRSSFLIYVNTTLVQWFLTKQSKVESSDLGTEFVTMKQGIDDLKGL